MKTILRQIYITSREVLLDRKPLEVDGNGREMLSNIYRSMIGGYPKFHKMDPLCRLGFIAAELLLKGLEIDGDEIALTVVGRDGSLATDLRHQSTLGADSESLLPSPAIFVYTLPNIVTGEVAIRHNIHGETSCYILNECEPADVARLVMLPLMDSSPRYLLGGWINCTSADDFECRWVLADVSVSVNQLIEIYKQ